MASPKNSTRRKRKYGEARKATTLRNRQKRHQRGEARVAKLIARTQSLIGKHVAVRTKDYHKPLVGTVLEVIGKDHDGYPHAARRHYGRYLRVRTVIGDLMVSRHRTKPIKE